MFIFSLFNQLNGISFGAPPGDASWLGDKPALAALLDEHRRLLEIIDDMHVALWEWDVRGEALAVNARWAEISGHPLAALAGLRLENWFAMMPPDDAERAQTSLARHVAGDEPVFTGEFRLRKPAGSWAWVEVRGRILRRNARGDPLRMAGTMNDISSRKTAEAQVERLAFYDPLTELPNRRLLLDRLIQAQAVSARSGQYGALMLIDLDHFKNLNDTLGYGAGDRLLLAVTQRLQSCLRAGDTLARLGGDEFALMLPWLSECEAEAARIAETIAEKIRQALNEPYAQLAPEGEDCHSTPSIGVSLFLDHSVSTETLLRQSDLAMCQAKDAGRNAIRFYNPQMQSAIDARAAIERGLRKALASGELQLHFQPQVSGDGVLVGAEALLRWQPPGRQAMPPDQFIPVAESSGLILPIGHWVLDFACATLQSWSRRSGPGAWQLAVNVSARQFHQRDFVDQVRRLLDIYETDPARLKLELTESLVLDNVEETIAKMRELKAMGLSFSLDDFGTGYSSLSYLKRLPIDQLKIDRSFVRDIASDPDDAAIVQAILGMSQALHLDVVAEGVENEVQRDFLRESGCRTFQGYLFSRALPLAEFNRWRH